MNDEEKIREACADIIFEFEFVKDKVQAAMMKLLHDERQACADEARSGIGHDPSERIAAAILARK